MDRNDLENIFSVFELIIEYMEIGDDEYIKIFTCYSMLGGDNLYMPPELINEKTLDYACKHSYKIFNAMIKQLYNMINIKFFELFSSLDSIIVNKIFEYYKELYGQQNEYYKDLLKRMFVIVGVYIEENILVQNKDYFLNKCKIYEEECLKKESKISQRQKEIEKEQKEMEKKQRELEKRIQKKMQKENDKNNDTKESDEHEEIDVTLVIDGLQGINTTFNDMVLTNYKIIEELDLYLLVKEIGNLLYIRKRLEELDKKNNIEQYITMCVLYIGEGLLYICQSNIYKL